MTTRQRILSNGLHSERKKIHLTAQPQETDEPGVDPTRQVFAATWLNESGSPIQSFKTTFVVPEEPSKKTNQLLYLFPGMQNRIGEVHIVQPILQWGINSDGIGSNSWTLASWCVGTPENGGKQRSGEVAVAPGATVTAAITLTGHGNGLFIYDAEFLGFPLTKLSGIQLPELTFCVQALETYRVMDCAQLSGSEVTRMSSIELIAGNDPIEPGWQIYPGPAGNCGQRVNLISAAEVDIVFRSN